MSSAWATYGKINCARISRDKQSGTIICTVEVEETRNLHKKSSKRPTRRQLATLVSLCLASKAKIVRIKGISHAVLGLTLVSFRKNVALPLGM